MAIVRTTTCNRCGEPVTDRGPRARYHSRCLILAQRDAQSAQRKCKRCRKLKAASSFSNDVSRPDGKFPWCKSCQNESSVSGKFQDENAEVNGFTCPMCDAPIRGHVNRRFCSNSCKDRVKSLKRKYNLEPAQYRAMVKNTGGRCPICKNRVRQWHVDHNHKTGLVMGVVCAACNVGALAATYHDPEFVQRLLWFLVASPASLAGVVALAPPDQHGPSQLHRIWGRRSTPSAGT